MAKAEDKMIKSERRNGGRNYKKSKKQKQIDLLISPISDYNTNINKQYAKELKKTNACSFFPSTCIFFPFQQIKIVFNDF